MVDGVKTGFTESGGYGIAISAKLKTTRFIIIVNGLDSHKERIKSAQMLLKWGKNLSPPKK